MGNKPRAVPGEKLIESLQNSKLRPLLGSSHDMFQAVHALGAPSMTSTLSSLHPPLDSFAQSGADSNLLELLGQSHDLNPAGQSDVLANDALNKSSQKLQRHEVQSKSWTSSTKLPSSPLWMLHRNMDQTKFSLPGLVGSTANSPTDAVTPANVEDRSRQPVWCDRTIVKQAPEVENTTTVPKLPTATVKVDKLMMTEAMAVGDSPSPRGNVNLKDVSDIDTKQMDSSDCSDHNMDEQDEKNPSNSSQMGMGRTVSKNLVSERKRRKKLNEGLYTLRALVPRISKMDKASIIGDAIDYVRELQKQVEELQAGISDLETRSCTGSLGEELSPVADIGVVQLSAGVSDGRCWEEETSKSQESTVGLDDSADQKILELDVAIMEDQIYHLRIFCTKGPRVFVQLMQSLEALGMEVLNANLTSLQDNILNTFIAEIKDWEMMKTEEVKKAIMDVAGRFGLQ